MSKRHPQHYDSMSEVSSNNYMRKSARRLPAGHGPKTSVVNVVIMSISFCLTFLSFSAAQNYATSADDNSNDSDHVGSTSLGILYSVFTFGNILSSVAVRYMGPKVSLILGSVTYGLFVAANILFKAYVMFPAAALLGLGAALIWTAEGVYVTRCAEYHETVNNLPASSTSGYFNGIFFFIFQINQFLGNALVALLFLTGISTATIFVITTFIALGGTCILFFIRNMPHPDDDVVAPEDTKISTTSAAAKPRIDLLDTLSLLLHARMFLLVPIIIYSGLSQAFIFGDFPKLIDDNTWKFLGMSVFGLSDALSSFGFGKLSDHIGRRNLLFLGGLVHVAVYLFLFFYTIPQDIGHKYIYFIGAVMLGIGDGIFNTLLYAVLSSFFPERSEAAFANLKLFQAATTAAGFFYNPYIGLRGKFAILFGALGAGFTGLSGLHFFVPGGNLDVGTRKVNIDSNYAPIGGDEPQSASHALGYLTDENNA